MKGCVLINYEKTEDGLGSLQILIGKFHGEKYQSIINFCWTSAGRADLRVVLCGGNVQE